MKLPQDRRHEEEDSTRKLMEKKEKQMIMDSTDIQNVEHAETCKTIRKRLREDIRNFNSKMIKTIVKQNGSLKKAEKNLAQGRQKLPAFLTVMDKRLQIKRASQEN